MNDARLRASAEITLIASTLEHVRAELDAPEQLTELLNATVSSDWPTGEYDRDAMEFFRARFEEGGDEVEGWYSWYAIREADAESPRALIGAGGYFGPPDADRIVEIGYSVLPAWQRRGYASAMIHALVRNAFTRQNVDRVIAHTTQENTASVAVLLRCGFTSTGPGRDTGTVRFERGRDDA